MKDYRDGSRWYRKVGKRWHKVIHYCAACWGPFHPDDDDPGCYCNAGWLTKDQQEAAAERAAKERA